MAARRLSFASILLSCTLLLLSAGTAAHAQATRGVLVSGTNAIVINAASTDVVTLRGLTIDGLGTGLDGGRDTWAPGSFRCI